VAFSLVIGTRKLEWTSGVDVGENLCVVFLLVIGTWKLE
jgi:hypothetical protein